jgi:polysaccharide pyruvyl transferase CsaB
LLDLIDAFAEIDWLIFGGGGLFQDVTGPGSAFYYGSLALMADFFKVPVLLWNQGVGPLKQFSSRWITQRVLETAHGITVRDKASADLVQDLTMLRPPITADPVWLLDKPAQASPLIGSASAWKIAISLRPHKALTDSTIMALVYFFKHLIGTHGRSQEGPSQGRSVEFMLLPMQPDQDNAPLERFAKGVAELGDFAICTTVQADRVPAAIAESHVLFGMRFHSLVLGLLCEIPVYGLMYDPKVSSLIEGLGLQGCDINAIDQMDETALRDYFANYPYPDIDWLRQRAQAGFNALDEIMNPLNAPI